MTKIFEDQLRHSRQRPQIGRVTERFLSATLQTSLQVNPIQRTQTRWPADPAQMFQSGEAPFLPEAMPAGSGLVAGVQASGDLGFGKSSLEKFGGFEASFFQRQEITFDTFWITHRSF